MHNSLYVSRLHILLPLYRPSYRARQNIVTPSAKDKNIIQRPSHQRRLLSSPRLESITKPGQLYNVNHTRRQRQRVDSIEFGQDHIIAGQQTSRPELQSSQRALHRILQHTKRKKNNKTSKKRTNE